MNYSCYLDFDSIARQSARSVRRAGRAVEALGRDAGGRARTAVKSAVDELATAVKSAEELAYARGTGRVLPSFPRTLQLDDHSCGAESAFMILKWFGVGRSPEATRRLLGTDEDGTDARAIADLFRARGLRPRVVRAATLRTLRRAIDVGAPSVVSLDGDHWGVVYGYDCDGIYLADPSVARAVRVRHGAREFLKRWDGWAMLVHGK